MKLIRGGGTPRRAIAVERSGPRFYDDGLSFGVEARVNLPVSLDVLLGLSTEGFRELSRLIHGARPPVMTEAELHRLMEPEARRAHSRALLERRGVRVVKGGKR